MANDVTTSNITILRHINLL